jgi:hypothetical protein
VKFSGMHIPGKGGGGGHRSELGIAQYFTGTEDTLTMLLEPGNKMWQGGTQASGNMDHCNKVSVEGLRLGMEVNSCDSSM